MLLMATGLPYTFYTLLAESNTVVSEGFAHRQDKLVRDHYEEGVSVEIMCNEASNVSPLSCVAGTRYSLPSKLFINHFIRSN